LANFCERILGNLLKLVQGLFDDPDGSEKQGSFTFLLAKRVQPNIWVPAKYACLAPGRTLLFCWEL